MFDVTSPSDTPGVRLQRARGRVDLSFRRDEHGVTRPVRLFQEGAGKMRLPAVYDHAGVDAVLINTAGGLTGGDRFRVSIRLGEGGFLRATTQASEKLYRRSEGWAGVETELEVAPGAEFHWIPQDTILFDRSALDRSLKVNLTGTARFLGLEMLVFGRRAMGESVRQLWLRDRWRVYRDGALVHAEQARLEGDAASLLARPSIGGGADCCLTGLVAGQDVEVTRDRIRAMGSSEGVEAACGLVHGLLVIRALGRSSALLRRWIAGVYRDMTGLALPRAWSV